MLLCWSLHSCLSTVFIHHHHTVCFYMFVEEGQVETVCRSSTGSHSDIYIHTSTSYRETVWDLCSFRVVVVKFMTCPVFNNHSDLILEVLGSPPMTKNQMDPHILCGGCVCVGFVLQLRWSRMWLFVWITIDDKSSQSSETKFNHSGENWVWGVWL